MRYKFISVLTLAILLFQCDQKQNWTYENQLPEAVVTDVYHGQKVEDPYRFMEALDDSTVLEWYDSLSSYTDLLLDSIAGREILMKNIKEDYSRRTNYSTNPKIIDSGQMFYLKYQESFTLSKLFMRESWKDENEIVIYDPVEYKPEAEDYYVIDFFEPSLDGSKVAVSLKTSGDEISEMIVIDVASKKAYPELITNCWPAELGGVSWLPDHSGFMYTYIPTTDRSSENYLLNTESRLHKVGQVAAKDYVVLSNKNNPDLEIAPSFFPIARYESSSQYFFGRLGGARDYDDYFYAENLSNPRNLEWKRLYKPSDLIESFETAGDDLIYLTANGASNFRICKTSLQNPDYENPIVLVEEDENAIVTEFGLTESGIFFVKVKNGVEAKVFHRNNRGEITEVPLPKESGSVKLYTNFNKLWIETLGWTDHTYKRFIFASDSKQFEDLRLKEVDDQTSVSKDIVVREVEVLSHDGVKVPLSIIYKKGVERDGKNRVLMTAYGAYGNAIPPYLEPHLSNWVELGGIYAVAHVRGGGEKGNDWHLGGKKATKPNSWKDFIACTEYLIDNDYTQPRLMAIWAASAGGIVVGRAITERPDLYAAAIVTSGMLNPLRSENGPNGPNNIPEYGTSEDSLEFRYLYEMDAFHHIEKNQTYPAVLAVASLNDARVAIWHSGKFISKMMAYSDQSSPMLMHVSKNGGHVGYAGIEDYYQYLANDLSFALWRTGHPDFQLK